MCREVIGLSDSVDGMNRRNVIAAAATLPLTGCTVLGESRSGPHIELKPSCYDWRENCTVYLHVNDLADAAYIEMKVVDRFTGKTDIYTVDYDDPVGVAHTGQVGDRELQKRDRVIVTAVYSSGERDQLVHLTLQADAEEVDHDV